MFGRRLQRGGLLESNRGTCDSRAWNVKSDKPPVVVPLIIALFPAAVLWHHSSVLERSDDLYMSNLVTDGLEQLLHAQAFHLESAGEYVPLETLLVGQEYARSIELRRSGLSRTLDFATVSGIELTDSTMVIEAAGDEVWWIHCVGQMSGVIRPSCRGSGHLSPRPRFAG